VGRVEVLILDDAVEETSKMVFHVIHLVVFGFLIFGFLVVSGQFSVISVQFSVFGF
jgi:hypothetical protein